MSVLLLLRLLQHHFTVIQFEWRWHGNSKHSLGSFEYGQWRGLGIIEWWNPSGKGRPPCPWSVGTGKQLGGLFANLVTRKGLPANSYGVPTFPANRIFTLVLSCTEYFWQQYVRQRSDRRKCPCAVRVYVSCHGWFWKATLIDQKIKNDSEKASLIWSAAAGHCKLSLSVKGKRVCLFPAAVLFQHRSSSRCSPQLIMRDPLMIRTPSGMHVNLKSSFMARNPTTTISTVCKPAAGRIKLERTRFWCGRTS